MTSATQKWVYAFGEKQDALPEKMTVDDAKTLLGGKGANLAEMCRLHLPVPPGFTITTEVCTYFYQNNQTYPVQLKDQVRDNIAHLEQQIGARFGDVQNPLLVSVRSGARASMPGMMDTVLNLGLNDETARGLAEKSGDARFAYDSYRRFITMYSDVVLGVEHHEFEDILDSFKRDENLSEDTDVSAENWQEIIVSYKELVKRETGTDFPQDPHEQLWGAIGAVFQSWMNPRAKTYRALNNIPAAWGTAVNVQAMVFGNMGADCATGVAFTRNPSTGENRFYGEFLVNAQGEDVVAGIRTPQQLSKAGREEQKSDLPSMEDIMPKLYGELCDIRTRLEQHYRDMQDIEFTIQQGKLYMLQTRAGKRTAEAALRIAVEMVEENLIDKEEAVRRVDALALDQLLHPTLDPKAAKTILATGLPASPGAASGQIVFSADDAEKWANEGKKVILCRIETSPEDIHGMAAAAAILTTRGGMTSHAAVVARGMGRACIAGAGSIHIDLKKKEMTINGQTYPQGHVLTIDGGAGQVIDGEIPTIQPKLSGNFATLMGWADSVRRLSVRANADTPHDAKTARDFGAEGIGLCRTEHMFFEADRILRVREMILAETEKARLAALAHLEPVQMQDFIGIFKAMVGLPVTIRLLDPPLHEFLPQTQAEMEALASALNLQIDFVRQRVAQLHETNPMLGHRGCRLGISYPEIYAMQVRAIIKAAAIVEQETGEKTLPEIMLPLIGSKGEADILTQLVRETAQATAAHIEYKIGITIEVPRACLMAHEIADNVDFFSFGTNDLTQTTLGLSRDDAGTFLPEYQRKNIYAADPFASLDQEGVGQLIALCVERGRTTTPHLKIGICGEHGGDPASIAFCDKAGLDSVSCSPYRVPIARLAAAQATLKIRKENEDKTTNQEEAVRTKTAAA